MCFTSGLLDWGFSGTALGWLGWDIHNLDSYMPLCPCAPLSLWRWVFDGLMAPVMGLGGAGYGFVWMSAPQLCLSVLLCGCVDELFSQNLAKCRRCICSWPMTTYQSVASQVPVGLVGSLFILSLLEHYSWVTTWCISKHLLCTIYVPYSPA